MTSTRAYFSSTVDNDQSLRSYLDYIGALSGSVPMDAVEICEYYRARQVSAVLMSRAASEPYIERLHLEMARRYEELAQTPEDIAANGVGTPVCTLAPIRLLHANFPKNAGGSDEVENSEPAVMTPDR